MPDETKARKRLRHERRTLWRGTDDSELYYLKLRCYFSFFHESAVRSERNAKLCRKSEDVGTVLGAWSGEKAAVGGVAGCDADEHGLRCVCERTRSVGRSPRSARDIPHPFWELEKIIIANRVDRNK